MFIYVEYLYLLWSFHYWDEMFLQKNEFDKIKPPLHDILFLALKSLTPASSPALTARIYNPSRSDARCSELEPSSQLLSYSQHRTIEVG